MAKHFDWLAPVICSSYGCLAVKTKGWKYCPKHRDEIIAAGFKSSASWERALKRAKEEGRK